jgi:hypothetical protein
LKSAAFGPDLDARVGAKMALIESLPEIIAVLEAARILDRDLEVQRAVLPSSKKVADAHNELRAALDALDAKVSE